VIKNWLLAIRPKTLAASISPILLGSALAFQHDAFRLDVILLALFCALMLQVSVNFANDFFDGKSGVDTHKRLGPIRVTQAGLITPNHLKIGLAVATLLAMSSGLALVYLSHWTLLLWGSASLIAVYAYSGGPWPLASHGFGEVTVFVFFGLLAVAGTYYVHTGQITIMVLLYGSVVGLMSAAIMLVNNIRDIPTDTLANKRTLAVVLGEATSRALYKYILVAALVLHLGVSFPLGFYSFIPLLIVAPFVKRLISQLTQRHGKELNDQLAETAKLELVYCVLMSLVLVFV
jgi:1,4-dihydroxy-2-naphthoate octaprenyltransferase